MVWDINQDHQIFRQGYLFDDLNLTSHGKAGKAVMGITVAAD